MFARLYFPKKLELSPDHAATPRDPLCCGLFTLNAKFSQPTSPIQSLDFLIDTGSCVSIVPRSFSDLRHPTGALRAANGSSIPTFGRITISFQLDSIPTHMNWTFIIADTLQPILGADFFESFGFLVDCKNHSIILPISQQPSITPPKINTHNFSTPPSCATVFLPTKTFTSTPDLSSFLSHIEAKYPNCFKPSPFPNPDNNVLHFIPTLPSQPYRTKHRELPFAKRQAVEREFHELENSGVIRRSSSPWASAIHVVSKPDGSFRPCGDYRFLNSITIHDSYPMPLITDILTRLHNKTYFSKIDLAKAFHQIPVNPNDICKTAVITPFGLFEYVKMPFGLRNAAQSFQRHIDYVLRGLDFARPYLDDILVFSDDLHSHTEHLNSIFQRLHDNHLLINIKKCQYFASEVQFLGHSISSRGISTIPEKLKTIATLPLPKTVTNLRSFLGAVNFYHRFIPMASSLLSPLSALTVGPKSSLISWTDHAKSAFEHTKLALTKLVTLKFYDPECALQLTTDASDSAIGAVLQQIRDEVPEPLEFFSKTLSSAQKNYSAFDRELLAIHDSVKHFQNLLEGRTFSILTDHKPLIHLATLHNPSPRQLRQTTFLSEFNFTISHVPGKDNVVADYLSRPHILAISRSNIFSDSQLSSFPLSAKDISLFTNPPQLFNGYYIDHSIPGNPRPILPQPLRRQAFDSLHSLHHPGIHATYRLLHTRFVWPSMRKDNKQWCQECIQCQKHKISRHTKPPIMRFPTGNRFETLHLDIVGPLPMSEGKSYILTMIDRKTRWPEAVPIANISASNVAKHLIQTWISRYGVPNHIITDQGTQFESSLFDSLSTSFGFKHIHTTTYHPQSNGLIERFHRSLKTSLRCLSISSSWTQSLPLVLLGWRNTIHGATGSTPATLLFGTGTALPNDFFTSSVPPSHDALDATRKHFLSTDTNPSFGPKSSYKPYIPSTLRKSEYVWVQSQQIYHLNPRYSGPFKVLKFHDNNTISILREGKPYTINLEKVKPAYGFSDHLQIKKNNPDPEKLTTPEEEITNQTSVSPPVPAQNKKIKKTVTFTSFVRIWDPQKNKNLPFKCIRMKE